MTHSPAIMRFLPKSFQQMQLPKLALLLLLLLLLGIGAAPSYLTGHWRWAHPPKDAAFKQLRNLENTELNLPGWKTRKRQTVPIGGHEWLAQEIEAESLVLSPPQSLNSTASRLSAPEPARAVLLLTAPRSEKNQPEVEWMDINGFQRWTTDSARLSRFTVDVENSAAVKLGSDSKTSAKSPIPVKARFLRGWNQQQTFAVLQWYAWPAGGSPAPSDWFWADRAAQLRNARQPWVAVCLLIPIEPLGEIDTVWPMAESLAQTVQAALIKGPLTAEPRSPGK
ncbi:cyanoexosortase B system-associated protein [Trichocoleus desertorum AS-A10]|uniref:cyanoexosortase B system-associated protein n=1 Tax=Trichocoleus desertorum TaxID=1481672 RepID=UPI00329969C1